MATDATMMYYVKYSFTVRLTMHMTWHVQGDWYHDTLLDRRYYVQVIDLYTPSRWTVSQRTCKL